MICICEYAYIFTVPSPLSGCPDLVRQPVLVQTCLILMSYTGESQPNIGEIYRFRARNYYLYMMMICLYIYRACSFSVCCCTVNSDTDLVSQKQSSSSNCQSSNPSESNCQTSTYSETKCHANTPHKCDNLNSTISSLVTIHFKLSPCHHLSLIHVSYI